jgi:hypothetical protein
VILATKALAAIGLLVGCFFFGYHQGRLSLEVLDQKALLAQAAQEAKRTRADTEIISEEGQTYAKAVADAISEPDPAPAVVCVRKYVLAPAVAVPSTATAGPTAHAGDRLPPGAPGPIYPVTDISQPATLIGARANAQVAGLRDYITRVCLAP